jgi:hypothetical protein
MNIAQIFIVIVHHLFVKEAKIICKSGTYNSLSNTILGYVAIYVYLYE